MKINIFTGIAEIHLEGIPQLMGEYFFYKYSDDGIDGEQFGYFILSGGNLPLWMEIRKLRDKMHRGNMILPEGKNYPVDMTLIRDNSELELGNIRFRFEFAPGTKGFSLDTITPDQEK